MPNKLNTIQKSQSSVKNLSSEYDSKSQSRFPLTGSYGGIISVNNESKEHEQRPRSMPGSDSGFIEQPSRSVILRHNTPDQEIRNKRPGLNNFLQQEKHLANCVRLIAADMEEFEREPESHVDSHQHQKPVPFFDRNAHTTMIPNAEIFKGTCADDGFGLINLAPQVKFPSQPLDLSTLPSSAASVSPEPSKLSAPHDSKLQSTQEKGKRKRVRKQTESHVMNIMPMTPMPHMSKDDSVFKENEPSTDSGIVLSSGGSERILVAPKKRKRNYKQKTSDSSSQGAAISYSVEERPKTTSPPSLIPIYPTRSSSPVLSMPLIGEIENPGTASATNIERFSIKQEVSDNEDRELGLVIDTDGEED